MDNWFRRLILGVMLTAAASTGIATLMHTFVADNLHSDRPTASSELGAASSSDNTAHHQPTENGHQPTSDCDNGGSGCHTLFCGPSSEMTHIGNVLEPIDFHEVSGFSASVGISFRPPIKNT
jgi:hypothetical protein